MDRRRLAWDCATGNGQAAVSLADHFDRVLATDISAEQIRYAVPHPRIEYRVAPADHSGLPDGSADLVTVASALHWFDLEAFSAEVRRVARPGAVLAAWTYHAGTVEPPFDEVFRRFYWEVVAPFFAPGARLVDQRYETMTLPGTPIEAPSFLVTAEWTLEQMLAYIASWSGTQRYIQERGEDPAALIAGELERLWEGRDAVRAVRWPLYVRVSRV